MPIFTGFVAIFYFHKCQTRDYISNESHKTIQKADITKNLQNQVGNLTKVLYFMPRRKNKTSQDAKEKNYVEKKTVGNSGGSFKG